MAIYLTARSKEALKETQNLVEKANPNTQCAYSVCEVSNARQVEAAVKHCVAQFGGIDVADANDGYLEPSVKIGESDPEGWWRNWEVNMRGSYHVIRYTLPHLVDSAKTRASERRSGGHLVLISSIDAQFVMPGASDYQTCKHAINRLCEFVQSDHDGDGIKCFAMHPGGVATDLGHNMPAYMHEHLVDDPDLAASFAVWLCSGHADWAKGRYLSANWDVRELTALQTETLQDDLQVNRLRAKS